MLARHEQGLFEELKMLLCSTNGHRSEEFDRLILPECLPFIQAIGHRMAYDAAVKSNVDQCLIDLYVASCIKLDPAWYVENLSLSRQTQREREASAIDAVFPRLEEYLAKLPVKPYITAPIVSDETWSEHVASLKTNSSSFIISDAHTERPTDIGLVHHVTI
jgi:hypothetical protein